MKRTRLTILSACLLLFVATIASAAPPAGWDPYTTPSVSGTMTMMGSVTLNDLPLPVDNASLIAVFVDNAAVPVGVYKMTGTFPYSATTGSYNGLTVYGYDPGMLDVYSPPKVAAFNGDLLTFKLYYAAIDNVVDVVTVRNYGNIDDAVNYPWNPPQDNVSFILLSYTGVIDNATLNFRYDFPPVFDTVPTSGSINEGEPSSIPLHAVDPNGDAIAYSATGLPGFCSLISMSCNPSFSDAATYDNICFTATSTGFSGIPKSTAPACVTLTVINVNRPPTWTIGGDNTAGSMTTYPGQGTPFTRTYSASDLDNEALTWTLQNNPSYCSLTGSGNSRTLSCTPTLASQGVTTSGVRVIVSDGIDNTVDTLSIVVGNRKPVITAIDNQSVSYAKTGTTVIPVTISDPDGNGVLSDVSVTPWPPPSGLNWGSYDNVTHTITLNGPVPIQDNGAYIVTIHAMDNASIPLAADNTSFTLNIALQIAWNTVPTNKTMSEGDNTTFTFRATDPLAPGTETHLLAGKPTFCGTFNATTGALQCQPGYTDNGVYPMTLRARAIDNVTYAIPDNVSITLTVLNVNRPPAVVVGGDNGATVTGYPGTLFTRMYVATDLDNEALTWTTANLPSYCGLTPTTGNSRTLSCTPTLASQGTTASNVRVIVSDGIDNTVNTFDITVGNRKPVIGAIAAQNISYLKSVPTVIPVVLSDPDGNGVSFTATMSPSKTWFSYDNAARTITVTPSPTLPISDNGAYTVAITATDNAGIPLTDNTSFALNVVLQIAWDTVPANKTMNEGGDNTFTFHATDPLAPGTETHLLAGKPTFCGTFNATTGSLRCQPGYFDNGVYTMTLRARAIDNVAYALPDNVSITLTVLNVNRSPVLTPTPAGALSGNVGAILSKSYAGSDLDNEALTWTTANMPSFCQLTPSTGNIRTFTCSPTAANEGIFDNVVVRVSDGTAQAEESFSVTVNNRAPSISAIADREIVYTAGSTTTIPVVASDPDGNGVTTNATLSPSRGWFSFSGNVITIGTGIPRSDAGIYTVTVTATDNGVPARSAVDVTFTLRVTYPRHFGIPAAQAASMSLGVSGLALNGTPAPLFDEVAAFSVHRVPDSFPTKWESKLVGWGRVDGTAGVLPSMAVYGDNPSTASVREGMTNGEEILLVLWHNDPEIGGQEYYAFDNGAGAPFSVTWDNAVASKSLDEVNFIPGNRYPLRNGAWNLFGHGIATGYYVTGAGIPTDNQLTGTTITWNAQADLGNAFPFKSIEGKFDRIISREGSGNKLYYPPIKTMSYFAPGYGYYIRMKAAPADLSWITVPGSPVSASASLAAGPGYSLLGVWDESHVYSQAGYDPTGELRSLRAFVDPGVVFDTTLSSIGDVFGSAGYDRIIMYDSTGARFFLQTLPPQFNTLRYVAPGYGFWINVTNPSGMTVDFPPARD
jgi:hypothetical protein